MIFIFVIISNLILTNVIYIYIYITLPYFKNYIKNEYLQGKFIIGLISYYHFFWQKHKSLLNKICISHH